MKIRSFLKWAGGKYRCLEKILPVLPPASRLIEPFTGSASIFLNADYPRYLLAEKNPDLIHLFHYIQWEGTAFIEECEHLFTAGNNQASQYYALRDQFNQSTDPKRRALLFLYLNRHGYNGLCRYNLRGLYNVPFGRYVKPSFPREALLHFYQKSQLAELVYGDFQQTFALAQAGDIIYCDPPYVPLSSSARFAEYTTTRFNESAQIQLAELALATAKRGIPVVISNHDTAFTRHHYRHGEIQSFPIPRAISCNALQRLPVQELVAIFR